MTIQAIAAPSAPAGAARSSLEVARRTLRKFFRTPGLWAMGIVQTALFELMFRYVFGGAVAARGFSYVNYFIPGFVATILLFTGAATAVGVAEDRAQGFTDRLLSLPIPRAAIVLGRTLADSTMNAWSLLVAAAIGFAVGFRLSGTPLEGLAAFAICLLYGVVFTVVFIVVGLVASSAETAQGLSLVGMFFAFVSSTYVPVKTMPSWLQPFAANQPVSIMVDAVRSLIVGSGRDVILALVWSAALLAVCTPIAVVRYRRT